MPGTPDNWLTTRIVLGPGKLYGNLGGTNNAPWDIASSSVRLLLFNDGTPDATQNPNAIHLGMTPSGSGFSVKPTKTDFFADEFDDPIASRVTADEVILSGSLLQITDFAVQQIMNPTATRSDVAGTQGLTWGGLATITYRSFAAICPVEGQTGLYQVFHIYKGFNDQGMAAQITKTKLGESPFSIRGYAITTRTAGDQTARLFRQMGGGS